MLKRALFIHIQANISLTTVQIFNATTRVF